MRYPTDEKYEEVDSGQCWTGIQEGVDSSEKQEWVDILHVIAMSPGKERTQEESHSEGLGRSASAEIAIRNQNICPNSKFSNSSEFLNCKCFPKLSFVRFVEYLLLPPPPGQKATLTFHMTLGSVFGCFVDKPEAACKVCGRSSCLTRDSLVACSIKYHHPPPSPGF